MPPGSRAGRAECAQPVTPLTPLPLMLALVTTGGLALLAAYIWRSRATEGGGSFLVMIGAVALWVLCSGLEHSSAVLEDKVRLVKLAWLGVVLVPPSALVVTLHAAGLDRFARGRFLWALAIPAVTFATLALSNERHGWVWSEVRLDHSAGFPDLALGHGPAFWAAVAYHYGLLVLGSVLLWIKYAREWPRNRDEAVLVAIALVVPWLTNLRYLLSEAQAPAIDLTPYAFSVTAVCLSLALWRGHGVLNVVRVGRSQILDEMSDGALVVDARDRLVYANRAARQALDLAPVLAPVPMALALEAHAELLTALTSPHRAAHEITLHHAAGGRRSYDLRLTRLASFEGIPTSRVLVMRDVSESRRAQSALRDSEVLLRQVIDLVPHMIFAKDREGRYLLVNQTMAAARGQSTEEILGRRSLPPDAARRTRFERMLAEDLDVIDTGRPRHHPEVRWPYADGTTRAYQVSKIPFVDPATGEPAMLGIAIDVTERKQTEERMRTLAYHDALTGLPNREHFQSLLEKALATARRRDRRSALLFLDLDRFKQVNDRLGHAHGDALLRIVAQRLGDCVRLSDQIVRPGGEAKASTVSRLGGDEFTILLSEINEPLDAAVVAMRLLGSLAEPIVLGGQELFCTGSVGIAVFPDDADRAETLFHHADQAMYDAKRSGRGRYAFFRRALTEASERRHLLEQGLHQALAQGELALHYQPVRHARTGVLLGAEALLRWNHPALGSVSPEEFLPVAEDTGLIVPIGEWVLATACGQLREWRGAGFADLRLSVNLSGFQLRQTGLLAAVARALAESSTSPGQLELEITESTVLSDDDVAHGILRGLRDLGVGFALDDFGTGYSSLRYLRRFPFDAIKIDPSLVRDVVTDPGDRVLVAGVIEMAHGLGLRVVAEGVETHAQLERLREAGCDAVQGHLLSPPLPAPEFARFLGREKDAPPA